MSRVYRYQCTGRVQTDGFADFVATNLKGSRSNLKAFASELSELFRWPQPALTNSGSSANLAASLALREMCMKQDRDSSRYEYDPATTHQPVGEVLTAGFTFPSTMSSLASAGFTVKVVDVEKNSFCISPEAVKRAITKDTRAICVTHFLGFPAKMTEIVEIAKNNPQRPLLLLQDACETMELVQNGRDMHEYGDVSTWSFYHPHHLSSFGGGAVSSPHPEWKPIIESFIHWGRLCTCHYNPAECTAPKGMHHNFHYVRIGHNLEMSELNACFGRFQLQNWKQIERDRLRNYNTLYYALSYLPSVQVYKKDEACGSPFVFPITLRDSSQFDTVAKELDRYSVEIRTLMGGAIVNQPAYAKTPSDSLENTLDIGNRSFFVGIHQTLEKDDVDTVAGILHSVLSKV